MTERIFNQWVQADTRPPVDLDACECSSARQGERRGWQCSVQVPDGWQPVDIIRYYGHGLSLPPFYSGQISVNKRDVECICF